jgi:hypothetical protein
MSYRAIANRRFPTAPAIHDQGRYGCLWANGEVWLFDSRDEALAMSEENDGSEVIDLGARWMNQ